MISIYTIIYVGESYLLSSRKRLNHLLQCSRTMLVQGNTDQARGGSLNKDSALLIVGEFKELLAEIISERVCHQLHHMGMSFTENHLNICRISFFKFLLKISTSMLIFAKSVDFVDQGFELNIGKSIRYKN